MSENREIRFSNASCAYEYGHSDPDNSGLCIHCAAILVPMRCDIEDAEEQGIEVPVSVRDYVEAMESYKR